MSTGLLIAISVCVLVVVLGFILTRKKKVEFPPFITGTMPQPPEPTPEETGPPLDNLYLEPEVTPVVHEVGGPDSTPTQIDVNNEELQKLD